jgi:hypothetical protein
MRAWQLVKGRSRSWSASVRFLGRLAGWSSLVARFASWPHGSPFRVDEAGIGLGEGLPPLPGRNLLTRLSEPASRLGPQRGRRGLDPGWYILVALGLVLASLDEALQLVGILGELLAFDGEQRSNQGIESPCGQAPRNRSPW